MRADAGGAGQPTKASCLYIHICVGGRVCAPRPRVQVRARQFPAWRSSLFVHWMCPSGRASDPESSFRRWVVLSWVVSFLFSFFLLFASLNTVAPTASWSEDPEQTTQTMDALFVQIFFVSFGVFFFGFLFFFCRNVHVVTADLWRFTAPRATC